MKITQNGNCVRVTFNALNLEELESFLSAVGSLPSHLSPPLSDLKALKSSTSIASLMAFARKHPSPFERE